MKNDCFILCLFINVLVFFQLWQSIIELSVKMWYGMSSGGYCWNYYPGTLMYLSGYCNLLADQQPVH